MTANETVMQRMIRELAEVRTDVYFGKGPSDPPVTLRLDRLEDKVRTIMATDSERARKFETKMNILLTAALGIFGVVAAQSILAILHALHPIAGQVR